MTIRLVIADDHSVVLQGLRALLALEPDLEVSALCTDGLEAVEAVMQHRPDVLVVDSSMPRCTGLEAIETLRSKEVAVPAVILTATLGDETLVRCMRAGVEGIVLKESAATVLVEAIRTVARGGKWIPGELSSRAIELLTQETVGTQSELTPREREVVLLVAGGSSNKRTAADLGIAESTVKLHLHSAFTKLGVTNRVQLSLLARERGWL